MGKVELHLKYMNSLRHVQQSIDIYYDDLVPEFVVKITDGFNAQQSKHFHNPKLKSAIQEATKYLEKQVSG